MIPKLSSVPVLGVKRAFLRDQVPPVDEIYRNPKDDLVDGEIIADITAATKLKPLAGEFFVALSSDSLGRKMIKRGRYFVFEVRLDKEFLFSKKLLVYCADTIDRSLS